DAVDVELEGLGDRPLRGRDHHVGVVDGGGEREAAASALGPDAAVALHLHVHRESPVGDPAGADHARTPPGRRRTATVMWRVEWCMVSCSSAGPVQSHSEPCQTMMAPGPRPSVPHGKRAVYISISTWPMASAFAMRSAEKATRTFWGLSRSGPHFTTLRSVV